MPTKTKRTPDRKADSVGLNRRKTMEHGPSVMVGTSGEVSRMLNRAPLRRTVAVTFENDNEGKAAAEVYRQVGEFLPELIRSRQQERLEQVIGLLLPDVPPSGPALAQARMMIEQKRRILESGDYIPASEIAKLAGYSEINPSAQPNKWKREGTIFAISHNGVDYFPLFALDPEANYKPYPAIKQILEVFGEGKGAWSMSLWFAGLNSYLDDRRPQDLIESEPDLVIAAARDEREGLQHG